MTAKDRRRGRPGEAETRAAREALLAAARDLFSRHGFHAVSIRRLAKKAGVNSSLIQYHFGGKQGLYEEMFAEVAQPLLERMRRIGAAPEAGGDDRIRQFFSTFMGYMARTPWLPPLLVRDVLGDEGVLRDVFLQQYAEPGAGGILSALVRAEIEAGRLRPDLDPRLTALSMISLALFPFVGLPISGPVFGIDTSGAVVERLVDHTASLFYQGVSNPAPVVRSTQS